MKIALIGYGKMGKEIEDIALQRGHEIVFKSSSKLTDSSHGLELADVAIEFTRPDAAADNILHCFEKKVPVVVGTTGWYQRLPEIKEVAYQHNGTLLYSTNFSIGVNIVFHLNELLAKLMDKNGEYSASITEIHHSQKLDKPSGTAITLAEGILANIAALKEWKLDIETMESVLPIHSERMGDVPGTHIISYESDVDKIQITHEAKSRKGFALGAVKAAEWLHGKNGVYTMKDFLKF